MRFENDTKTQWYSNASAAYRQHYSPEANIKLLGEIYRIAQENNNTTSSR